MFHFGCCTFKIAPKSLNSNVASRVHAMSYAPHHQSDLGFMNSSFYGAFSIHQLKMNILNYKDDSKTKVKG